MVEQTWAEWLQSALDERGWNQAEFVRQSEGHIKADRISKWLSGKEVASHKFAVITANTLGTSHAQALRAAGFIDAAAAMERRADVFKDRLGDKEMTEGQLIETLRAVPDSAILRVLQLRAAQRESGANHAVGVAGGNWRALDEAIGLTRVVGGAEENVDPHEIDLSQGDVDLAASTDNSAVLDQKQPDYENESQDPEEER